MVRQDDGWFIEDLAAPMARLSMTSPSTLTSTRLKDGDKVRCGQLLLIFHTQ